MQLSVLGPNSFKPAGAAGRWRLLRGDSSGAYRICACALLLCAAGAWAARPARKARVQRKPEPQRRVMPNLPWHELDGVSVDFDALKKEFRPLLDQLRALQQSYQAPADHGAMVADRAAMRERLERLWEKMDSTHDRFKDMQKSIQLQAVPLAFASINASNFQEASGQEMAKALQYDEVHKSMTDWLRSARDDLQADQGSFDTAESLRVQRKRTTTAVVAGTGAVVMIISLIVWGSRRRSADTVYPSVQPDPAGAAPEAPEPSRLSGPVGTPLSGPASAPRLSGPVGSPASGPAPSEALLPAVLNQNFRVEREIGRGGMGLVYEATDLTLQRKVAIKRMRQELVESKKELDMFLSEARLVASLKHPNLVEILSIFREGGELYLVFEFVAGKALHAYLEDGRRLAHKQAAGVLRPVAAALDYAHSKKVIHRDLKPSNIMITFEGLVKVMDFGIAHQAKKTVAKLTRADAWGTPPYMAPEQELGTVSRESDLYSMGVCYYEMLTGELPFQGPNFLAQKREMVYEPPSQKVAGLPKGVDEIVLRALQAEPKDRFHNGAEFIRAVDAAEKNPT